MNKAVKYTQELKALLIKIEESNHELTTAIKNLDRETSDILHRVEFEELDELASVDMVNSLKGVRQGRRVCKNELETMNILNDYINNYCGQLKDGLEGLENQLNYKVIGQEKKIYIPRSSNMFWE